MQPIATDNAATHLWPHIRATKVTLAAYKCIVMVLRLNVKGTETRN